MTCRKRRTQAERTAARRNAVLLFALPVLLSVLAMSGCVALTQANSPASKSSSGSSGKLSASASSLDFGNVVAGSSSVQTLTLTNAGSSAISISKATVTGTGFSLVASMSSVSIAAGQKKSFEVRFSPTTSGANSGSIAIASDATDSKLGVSLSGTGTAGLAISSQPRSQAVRAGQSATFAIAAAGSGTLRYEWKKNGTPINGATSATYTTPPATASENGATFTVLVTDDDESVTSVAATLTVDAAPPAPSTLTANKAGLNFSTVNVGASSMQPVVFTNTGSSEITIANVSVAGAGYSASGLQSGQILAPGQAATLDVTFDPSATGPLSGSVTVTSNAANSPETISLTGAGEQLAQHSATLSWTASGSTVAGYNVYRSSVSGGPYAKLDSALVTATTSTDGAVQAGQTYYYVVTSVESSGLESVYSSEVSATIP